MSEQTKAVLKTFFETGDVPSQAQFIDFIDSYPNIADLGNPIIAKHFGIAPVTTIGTTLTTISDVFAIPANTLTVNGQALSFKAVGTITGASATKDWSVFVAGVDNFVGVGGHPTVNPVWVLECQLIRISSTLAILQIDLGVSNAVVNFNNGTSAKTITSTYPFVWANANTLELRGRAPVSGSISFAYWNVKEFKV